MIQYSEFRLKCLILQHISEIRDISALDKYQLYLNL